MLKYIKTVTDRDARRNDDERICEARILRITDLVERVIRDNHRHHDGLASSGRKLECESIGSGVRVLIVFLEIVDDPVLTEFLRNFVYVNKCLERFYLAEEKFVLPGIVRPILKQVLRRLRYARIPAFSPRSYQRSYLVDEFVLLEPFTTPGLGSWVMVDIPTSRALDGNLHRSRTA